MLDKKKKRIEMPRCQAEKSAVGLKHTLLSALQDEFAESEAFGQFN